MEARLEGLAAGCLLPDFEGTEPPPWLRRWLERGLGGVGLFARNIVSPEQVSRLCAQLRSINPDVVIAIDEEGGDVSRLEVREGSSYPGNAALGRVDDEALTAAVATAMGADLRRAGVNLNYAPCADVIGSPGSPAIGIRSFGSDPDLAARHTSAYVRGLQSQGVAACAKHFPGHGSVEVDTHHDLGLIPESLDELRDGALRPFTAAIEAGTQAVMTAHLRVQGFGDLLATLNPAVLTGLLRGELGFQGLIVTDALDMQAVGGPGGMGEAAVLAIAAGADGLDFVAKAEGPGPVEEIIRALVDAVRSGRLDEARLADAGRRVRELARWASGLHSGPAPDPNVGLEAARRAIRASGPVELRPGALVVELEPQPLIAAGPTRWGIGSWLAESDPTVTVRRLTATPSSVELLLAAAPGRPVVLAVRDLHLHPWQRQVADAVLARRPDAVLVEMGLPFERPAAARAYVASYGAGRVNGQATAEVLLGRAAPAPA